MYLTITCKGRLGEDMLLYASHNEFGFILNPIAPIFDPFHYISLGIAKLWSAREFSSACVVLPVCSGFPWTKYQPFEPQRKHLVAGARCHIITLIEVCCRSTHKGRKLPGLVEHETRLLV